MSITIDKKNSAARILAAASLLATLGLTNFGLSNSAFAQSSSQYSNSQYSALPPIASREAGSIDIMLTLSVDHQLFREAYNDYDDIYQPAGEVTPRPEVTYEHNFNYAGYFNSELCYSYGEERFIAVRETNDENYCSEGGWSGNFLNWVSMTRLDMVRQVLYGGHRSTDDAGLTILERAPLVQDSHSFAKYYNGSDLDQLTDGLPTVNAPGCEVGGDEDSRVCAGYTFCNTSKPVAVGENDPQGVYSQNYRTPPLIRAVKGNYSLWASNERFQCVTLDEIPLGGSVAYQNLPENVRDYMLEYGVNGNKNPQFSGIWAKWVSPQTSSYSSNSPQVVDFIARVEPCNDVEMTWQLAVEESDEDDVGYNPRCQNYVGDNVSPKPVGLLQEPSLNHINFGLLTGSYDSNLDWGVLRKGVTRFNDTEVDEDGTFLSSTESIVSSLNDLRLIDYRYYATRQDTGNNLAAFRNGTYNGDDNVLCEWGRLLDDENPPTCRNWGNPFGELLAESYRYFAAKAGVTGINAHLQDTALTYETQALPGLTIASWPTSETESDNNLACTSRNVLAFNASGVSYDESLGNESLNTLFGLGEGAGTVVDWANKIGDVEIQSDQAYFFGELSSGGDGQCSAKQLGENVGLADVRGICPETPRSKGSYYGAGLSYLAHTQDLNPETELKDTVSTYGITLAGALPNIQVTAGEKSIVIIPACRNRGSGNETRGNCALVDFRPIAPDNPNTPIKDYYVGWEDSEQGGDYDLDISGVISYELVGTSLNVDTKIIYESATDYIEFGFSISGTGTALDGVYFPSKVDDDRADLELLGALGGVDHGTLESLKAGTTELTATHIAGFQNFDPVESDTSSGWCNSNALCSNVDDNDRHQRVTFNLVGEGSTAGKFLKDPLYYAVKWGSFKYEPTEENPVPNEGEWESDRTDQFGDPLPRGYDSVRNPKNLKTQFADIINSLLTDVTTGTASGIASNTSTGEGLSIQTFYMPELVGESGSVIWSGSVSGLFRDQYGNLREDSNSNGRLDVADKVVQYYFDTEESVTKARLYTLSFIVESEPVSPPDEETTEAVEEESVENDGDILLENLSYELNFDSTVTLNELNYVWDLNKSLNALDSNTDAAGAEGDNAFVEQVTTVASALIGNGRYIFTALDDFDTDATNGRILTETDKVDFSVPSIEDGQEGQEAEQTAFENLTQYLDIDVNSTLTGESLVNFIRGVEGLEGIRSRTLGDMVYRLGDVMHSTPTVVGRPQSSRLASLDPSYQEYRLNNLNRRQVAYVGGNDGMLHAINLGYYNGNQRAFYDNYAVVEDEDGNQVGQFSNNTGGPTTLGRELWAYVPFNALPHLKWLASPQYQHTYYVDGPIQTFDVKIFDDDAHPGGWGTIIVAAMRFGGGPYTVQSGDESQILSSAYVIFDVTNPLAPKLLGEVTHPNLGYTTGNVELVYRRQHYAEEPTNDWYLVFGSGPTNLTTSKSDQNAYLFTLDLKALVGDSASLDVINTGRVNSFVGGLNVEDWNNDSQSDAVYFGVVGDGAAGEGGTANNGALMHTTPSWSDAGLTGLTVPRQLLTGADANQPFSSAPLGVKDNNGNWWLFAGTGRYYVSDDLEDIEQNSLYGIRVNSFANGVPSGGLAESVASGSLLDVTDYTLTAQQGADVYQRLTEVFDENGDSLGTVDNVTQDIQQNHLGWKRDYQSSNEINYLSPLIVNDTLISDTFMPNSDSNSCDVQGKSYKYILDVTNGLPQTRLRTVLYTDASGNQVFGDAGGQQLDPALESENQVIDSDVTSGDNSIITKYNTGDTKRNPIGPVPLPPQRRSWREIPLEQLSQ